MHHFLQHEPGRGTGGEPKRCGDSPPCLKAHDRGQTDKGEAFARRVAVTGGGSSSKITEDVREYAAEQGIAEDESLKQGMEAKSNEFVEKGSEIYAKA